MKIISKYKDYYDYLVETYGEDPLVILDRRDFAQPDFTGVDMEVIHLYICDLHIVGLIKNRKFYYGKAIEPFAIPMKHNSKWINRNPERDIYCVKINNKIEPIIAKPEKCIVNSKLECPILMSRNLAHLYRQKDDIYRYFKFPILSQLGIGSVLEPEKIWMMLTEFLSKKDTFVDNRTNNEKIINAGFNLVESFRGK